MEVKNVAVFSLWKQFQFVPPVTTQSAANAAMLNLTTPETMGCHLTLSIHQQNWFN
jgi:hypothetical protein